ncbi:MAG: iodotyrosine deiodinase [Planctomycetota bacterium]|jgi:iodotyrosine deiodinase
MSSTEETERFIPLAFVEHDPKDMQRRAQEFHAGIDTRRSVRQFKDKPIPKGVLEECIRAASTAPSGAHRQPWTFVVVTEQDLKHKIRLAAEEEERETYENRLTDEWRDALRPLGTDANKPFLEIAPALIVVFRQVYGLTEAGERQTNYYTQESVGLASGFLLAALHHAGLATLTHTPSPMGFLSRVLDRPENEKAFLLIPVGYPTDDCQVPDLVRKPLSDVSVWR